MTSPANVLHQIAWKVQYLNENLKFKSRPPLTPPRGAWGTCKFAILTMNSRLVPAVSDFKRPKITAKNLILVVCVTLCVKDLVDPPLITN